MRDAATQRGSMETNIIRWQSAAGVHVRCVDKLSIEDVMKAFTGSRRSFGPGFFNGLLKRDSWDFFIPAHDNRLRGGFFVSNVPPDRSSMTEYILVLVLVRLLVSTPATPSIPG
jgi:hypothetical protein